MSRDDRRAAREEALAFALSRSPDVPGVGRLCQELLAETVGREVEVETVEPIRLDGRTRDPAKGKVRRSPWTEERRAKVELTWVRKRE